jgi:hypothetical protein
MVADHIVEAIDVEVFLDKEDQQIGAICSSGGW